MPLSVSQTSIALLVLLSTAAVQLVVGTIPVCASPITSPSLNRDGSINVSFSWNATVTGSGPGRVYGCNVSFSCDQIAASGGMSLIAVGLIPLSGLSIMTAYVEVFTEGFTTNWFSTFMSSSNVTGPVFSSPIPSPLPLALFQSSDVITIFSNLTKSTSAANGSSMLRVDVQCGGSTAPPQTATPSPGTAVPACSSTSRSGLKVFVAGVPTPTVVADRGEVNTSVGFSPCAAAAQTTCNASLVNSASRGLWVGLANISFDPSVYVAVTTNIASGGFGVVSEGDGGSSAANCSFAASSTAGLVMLSVFFPPAAPASALPVCVFQITLAPHLQCPSSSTSNFVATVTLVPTISFASSATGDNSDSPAALRGLSTAAGLLSGVSGNPNAASKASSVSNLRRLIVCQQLNDAANSLTGIQIGSRDFNNLRGAVVGNIGLPLLVFFVVFILCDVVAALSTFPFVSSLLILMELLHLPSITYPMIVAVMQPTIGSGMTLMVNGTVTSDAVLGAVAVFLCLSYVSYVWSVLWRGGEGRLVVEPVEASEEYRLAARDHPMLFRFFYPTHHYVGKLGGRRTKGYKRHFLFFFQDYRYRYYSFVNDLLSSVVLGLVAATAVTNRSVCQFQIACVLSIAFAQFVAAAVMSPCILHFDGIYLLVSNTISLALAGVMFVNSITTEASGGRSIDDVTVLDAAQDYLTYALPIPSLIKSIVDALQVIFALPRIANKVKLLFARRGAGLKEDDRADDVQVVSMIPVLDPAIPPAVPEGRRERASSDASQSARRAGRAATMIAAAGDLASLPLPRASVDDLLDHLLDGTSSTASAKEGHHHTLGETDLALDSLLVNHSVRNRSASIAEREPSQPAVVTDSDFLL